MSIMGVSQFERFFRQAASLDVDKSDLERLSLFLNQKLHDLLTSGVATARANGRDVIQPHDLPITRGFQQSIHQYRQLEVSLELEPILEQLARLPTLELDYSEELERRLPEIVGGLAYVLARCFRILDPELKNPQTRHWESAEQLFDLMI